MLDVPSLAGSIGSRSEGFREWIEQAVCIALITHGLVVDPHHLTTYIRGDQPLRTTRRLAGERADAHEPRLMRVRGRASLHACSRRH
eukprot:3992673-Prymnesium_polylepis.1